MMRANLNGIIFNFYFTFANQFVNCPVGYPMKPRFFIQNFQLSLKVHFQGFFFKSLKNQSFYDLSFGVRRIFAF